MSSNTLIPITQKAVLKSLTAGGPSVTVHFNPASLVYTVENSSKQQSGGPKRRQFAAQFSGKLTMDLQFDTTGTGEDVRQITGKVAMFMQASSASGTNPSSKNAQAPPVLSFQWGAYEFKGTMESFKETIDFFSADGIPLRALVSIGLARQDNVFDQNATGTTKVAGPFATSSDDSLVQTGSSGPSSDPTALSTMGGDPTAARALAANNGLESLRFTAGASLSVGAGIQLNAAAGFSASASASAGAGLSIGGGAGLSVGAGAGLSIGGGAGTSAGAGVSFGASAGVASSASLQISAGVGGGALFGGQASAGVPATAGAFAGLEVGRATVSTTTRLNPLRMMPATVSTNVSTGQNASFRLGGAANVGSGFSTDVGASFNFSDRLVFDQE